MCEHNARLPAVKLTEASDAAYVQQHCMPKDLENFSSQAGVNSVLMIITLAVLPGSTSGVEERLPMA